MRNNDLLELLKNANIKVPPFIAPKLLSCIVTVHNEQNQSILNDTESCDKTGLNEKSVQSSQIVQKKKVTESEAAKQSQQIVQRTDEKSDKSDIQTHKEFNINDSRQIKKNGSNDVLPVANASKCSKPVQNSVEITPLLSIANLSDQKFESATNNSGAINQTIFKKFSVFT